MSNLAIGITLAIIIFILMVIGDYIEKNKKNLNKTEDVIKEKYDKLVCNNTKFERTINELAKHCVILRGISLDKEFSNIVDLLLIDTSGIYCIKKINSDKNIIGDFRSDTLVKYSLFDKIKIKIDNPIIQNEKNVLKIKDIIGNGNIYNCVIFNNNYDLSNIDNSEHFIVGSEEVFLDRLNEITKENAVFTKNQIKELRDKLSA